MPGPIHTSNPRNDFRIIQIWVNIARYLAFAPLTVLNNSSKKNSQNILLPTIYPVFLFLVYLGGTIFSFYERYYLYKTFNISRIILDALQGVTEWMFIELVILWSISRRHRWRKLVRSITQFEHKVNLKFEGPVKDSNWGRLKVKIFLYHLVYLTTHIYDSIVNWTDTSYSLAFIIFRFTTYYIMFSTLLVTFFCTWLKNRYLFLEHFLIESVVHNKFKFVVQSEKEPAGVYYDRDKVKEFSHNYQSLYLIVQEFNEIFGYQIFFICIGTVLEILNAVNYGIPTNKNASIIIDDSFVNTLYSTLYVICTTRIVMACDSVEKCGMKLRISCLVLYESSEKVELKEELYKLEHYVQGLCPKFSAAGFWQVNQAVLSTLFSSVMTYLIIVVQFNITLGQ